MVLPLAAEADGEGTAGMLAEGAAVMDAGGWAAALLPVTVAKLVMSVQSTGRKYRAGVPAGGRICAELPWCTLRYQVPGPGMLVTPVTTRVWLLTSPLSPAVKSGSMYL